ncbi:hypothetical protein [Sporomusa acidovorans]|uniref:hypothetical protein n=1 Tax=Sporomusa acidovorans TaxID=112900 RepID=UPI000B8150C4|nr:hypothetical protein [Sporomusa acidovorans]
MNIFREEDEIKTSQRRLDELRYQHHLFPLKVKSIVTRANIRLMDAVGCPIGKLNFFRKSAIPL